MQEKVERESSATEVFCALTWNLQWRRVSTEAGQELRSRILAQKPDVVCLTEAHTDFELGSGHRITAEADYGYPVKEGWRKALLWSREPWFDVDTIGHPSFPPGRFVSGSTNSPIGTVRMIGVCIPWDAAHVNSGRRDRKRWEDHMRYLEGLRHVIEQARGSEATVLLGDFNQTIPRSRAPKEVYDALVHAIGDDFALATSGQVAGLEKPAIDHIAFSKNMVLHHVEALSPRGPEGRQLSDHHGIVSSFAEIPSLHEPTRTLPVG